MLFSRNYEHVSESTYDHDHKEKQIDKKYTCCGHIKLRKIKKCITICISYFLQSQTKMFKKFDCRGFGDSNHAHVISRNVHVINSLIVNNVYLNPGKEGTQLYLSK